MRMSAGVQTCALPICAILSIETRKRRTVEVEHTEQFVATQQRHHDFRLRGRIAGNVAGERVDVADDLRLAQACRGTAHALAECDPHAGRLALERTDNQLAALDRKSVE